MNAQDQVQGNAAAGTNFLRTSQDVMQFYDTDAKMQAQFPGLSPECEALSGGIVNFIFRIKYSGGTAVLKSFPPFIAHSQNVPLDQKRYHVEKAALELFGAQSGSLQIRVPRLLYARDDKYFLVMEDAGDGHKNLLDYMDNSFVSKDPHRTSELLDNLARELSKFLNGVNTVSLTREMRHVFRNEAAWSVLRAHVRPSYFEAAKGYSLSEGMAPYLTHVPSFEDTEEGCLCHGDLWPASLMVDEVRGVYWLLDWEMARFKPQDGTNPDLEQLLANLWVMSRSTKFDQERITSFIRAVESERFKGADWRNGRGEASRANFMMWVLTLVHYPHFGLDKEVWRQTVVDAWEQVKALQ